MAENNLRSFIDHVGHIGIAKKDRYAISITGPSQTPWTGYIPSVQEVNMMCESISCAKNNSYTKYDFVVIDRENPIRKLNSYLLI